MNYEIKLQHALIIQNTNGYEGVAAERQQGHADIVGDGELSLLIDDLLALLGKIGAKTEEVVNQLQAVVETQVDMEPVIVPDTVLVYDEHGKRVAL